MKSANNKRSKSGGSKEGSQRRLGKCETRKVKDKKRRFKKWEENSTKVIIAKSGKTRIIEKTHDKKELDKGVKNKPQFERKEREKTITTEMTTRTPKKPAGSTFDKENIKTVSEKKDRRPRGKITEYYDNVKEDSEEETGEQRKDGTKEEDQKEVEVVCLKDVKIEVRNMIKDLKNAFEDDKKKRKQLINKELDEWKKAVAEERAAREEEFSKERELWREERAAREEEIKEQKEGWERDFSRKKSGHN